MKTSELKKIVENNKCKFYKDNADDLILDGVGAVVARLYTKRFGEFEICFDCPRVIAQAILHYAYTPLEEREEKKKYYLKLPKEYKPTGYLNFHTVDKIYFNAGKIQEWTYQTQFTQKEIDEMPFDTKFFEKVLVG